MRDTSDMMEDALSEDIMMDCGGDSSGLEDLVELASDDSSPCIRDAAERLLTMLGVDDDYELLSSSEDEGVEVDVDEFDDDDDDDDEELNSRLLHQLAASLAQELKYSRQKSTPNSATSLQNRVQFDSESDEVSGVDMEEDESCRVRDYPENQSSLRDSTNHSFASDFLSQNPTKFPAGYLRHRQNSLGPKDTSTSGNSGCLSRRLDLDEFEETTEVMSTSEGGLASWSAGWDACTTEALRYLVEDEGLPLHHPTVLAMKNHLELQRERSFAQFAA